MNKTQIQLRRALKWSLFSYQRPMTYSQLNKLSLNKDIWRILIKHGCLCRTSNNLIQITDTGLRFAQRWFPSLRVSIKNLKKISDLDKNEDPRPVVDYSDYLG